MKKLLYTLSTSPGNIIVSSFCYPSFISNVLLFKLIIWCSFSTLNSRTLLTSFNNFKNMSVGMVTQRVWKIILVTSVNQKTCRRKWTRVHLYKYITIKWNPCNMLYQYHLDSRCTNHAFISLTNSRWNSSVEILTHFLFLEKSAKLTEFPAVRQHISVQ